MEQFNTGKILLVAVQGFEAVELEKLKNIQNELLSNSKLVAVNTQFNNQNLQDFKQIYKLYLNDFRYKNSKDINVSTTLSTLYEEIINSSYYVDINKEDPFNILKTNPPSSNSIKFKDGYLALDNYGYLAIFTINSAPETISKTQTYDYIQKILTKYDNVKSFSPIYYHVENSQATKDDANKIIFISTILLGLLYIILLKNIYLFVNIVITLVTSVIATQIILFYIFPQISIIALTFSIAITSVSIDYMFHHYLHNHYDKKLGFNKSVFYGYLTTVVAFLMISFVDFPLIRQISFFTAVSLTIAYIHFAFIYPHLGIKFIEPYAVKRFNTKFHIKGYIIVLISFLMIIYSSFYTTFDFNIKTLDYQNKKLIESEYFFKSNLGQNNKTTILITGNSINELIINAKSIHNIDKNATVGMASLLSREEYAIKQQAIKNFDFEALHKEIKHNSEKVGFKKGYFDNTYNTQVLNPPFPNYTVEMIQSFGIDLVFDGTEYIGSAIVSNEALPQILSLPFTKNAQGGELFKNSLTKFYDELVIIGTIILFIIISIILVATKRRFLQTFSYIIFPLSLIFFYGTFVQLNIMHIFMLFVIISMAVDYGIYMNEKNLSHNAMLAIVYSLTSTFAGFGVLIFSDINSLFSIASIAIIGICGILFLLLFQYHDINIQKESK